MRLFRTLPLLPILLVVLAACTKEAQTPSTTTIVAAPPTASAPATNEHPDEAIAWRRGDVDAAFAEARAGDKPVFLYWGAGWCPPCNQMKATLFNRRDFIERTRYFVPVYVDGDTPAAQKLGTRFSVSGYPTMVLFKPDGTEITRLPGEADPERYLQMLAIGMNAARPVRDTLRTALVDGKGLTQDDWRMLAWYSWDTDDQQLVPSAAISSTLQKLAAHCPAGFTEPHERLMLKTAAAAAPDPKAPAGKADATIRIDRAAALAQIEAVLANPPAARANFDLLTNAMPEMVRATTAAGSPERRRLVAHADDALARLAADTSLSNTDRLDATIARVQLATLEAAPGDAVRLPDALSLAVQSEVARADRESTNPYERQTVINAAADLLATAGRLDDSDALLKAELVRSHSPYYFMLDLAANAKKRGDKQAAIDWYAKAYEAAKGPATRLQWGATYVDALVELSPDDAARIEQAAKQVIGEVEPAPESFDGRNRKSLSRMADRLATWNARGDHSNEAARIVEASRSLCARVPEPSPERARCAVLLKVTTLPKTPTVAAARGTAGAPVEG